MMKRCRYVVLIAVMITAFVFGFGCSGVSTSKSYTYEVETGDKVKIKLDTSNDYDMTSELPFEISCGGEVQSQGTFIDSDTYRVYAETMKDADDVKIIDSGSNSTCEYVMWNYDDAEFNYVILIKDSKTGMILANDVSEQSAKECFERLEISVE